MTAEITVERLKTWVSWGWVPIGHSGVGDYVTLRWTTEHETPEWARRPLPGRGEFSGAWPEATYRRHTFLGFTARDGVVYGQVLHGDARAPWVARTDSWISQKHALELVEEAMSRQGVEKADVR